MNWLNFFDNKTTQTLHPFGRGINANLSPNEEELFNKSSEAFESKKVLDAYNYFFESLENFTNNVSNKNIIFYTENDTLFFTIFQGTAKITGHITQENLYAESIICLVKDANVSLKRYLLDRNYQFTYTYYFMDKEYIKLKLYHDNITMTPQKIFFPLREIALNADFDKEFIKSEFEISIEEISHLEVVDENELQIKYNFMQSSINETMQKIEMLPSNDNSGMQSFLLLNTLFMIDYLLVPKYEIYQKTSKKIQEYFSDQSSQIEFKNEEIKEFILKLQSMSFAEYSKNNFNAKYTFNATEKTSKEDMDTFINESLIKIRWYKNNRYNQIIPIIYKYIAFYILYNYGINPILKELMHTLVEIQNQHFFIELGYPELHNEITNSFAKKKIIARIDEIIEPNKNKYKKLESFGEKLNYSSLNELSNSFYLQLQNLNFEEI